MNMPVRQVACGWQHTLCLTQAGSVYSWGYGEEGQLGHGDAEDSLSPREVCFFPNNNLSVSFVAAGHSHSGVITVANTEEDSPMLFLWGANQDHRLMQEDTESRFEPCMTILE